MNMSDISEALGSGKSFGIGRVGLMFYAARTLGVPMSSVAPLIGLYEASKIASNPATAIEVFSRIKGVLDRAQAKMPGEVKTAFNALLNGSETGAKLTALESARQYMLDRPFGKAAAAVAPAFAQTPNPRQDEFTGATKEYIDHLRAISANPFAMSQTIGQSVSGLPPYMRNAAMMNAQARINFMISQAPPLIPAVGMGNAPTLSKTGALNFSDVANVTNNPAALWMHFGAGTLRPAHIQAARIGWPLRLDRQLGMLHTHLTKLDTPPSMKFQRMYNIATGGTGGLPGASPNAFSIYQDSFAQAEPPESSMPLSQAKESRGKGGISEVSGSGLKSTMGRKSGLLSDRQPEPA
jgi:hypothetical protein